MKVFVEENGEEKLLKLFSAAFYQPIEQYQEIILAPSVLYYDWSLTSEEKDSCILLYGTKKFTLKTEIAVDKEKVVQAFKILADEKRINIIRLLSQGPLYGYELGKRLHLSNSTVSHHLSSLTSIGAVKAVRKENRVYFEIQKEELEKILNQVKEVLIRE
ncbi:winged helix-turn-helix transcriptional regulator [Bacillaceae bacterium Marseille-Q3522]|nr:winged helix-turn-helix transcriptional regulator [Bacillaceae bacterium Marseille-Q3522]